jgi:uncharacterized membrane protein
LAAGSVLAINIMRHKDEFPKDASPVTKAEVAAEFEGPSPIEMREVPPVSKNDSDSEANIPSLQSDRADEGVYFDVDAERSGNADPSQIQEDRISDAPPSGANLSQKSSPSVASFGDEADGPVVNSIVISSEMEAVMQTLTARERAVLTTLIEHGGRMTQAEIRYETSTPKSSLTGILISLERRKLITKKEWGRTNIIELSLWFLSKKEPS